MPEFIECHVLGAGFVFTMFQGVARHLLQQNCEYKKQDADVGFYPNPAYKVQWSGPLKVIHGICFTFDRIDRISARILQPWLPMDLPCLLFMSAILRTLIALRIAILRACRYGRTVLSIINLRGEPQFSASIARQWKWTDIL